MTPAEFDPAFPSSELPEAQALERAATGICKYFVFKMKQGTQILCEISYKEKLPKYLERRITHHDRLRMNKCCKISRKYTSKNTFFKHPTYFGVLPFVLKSVIMVDRRNISGL
jgi:hypothetical protein